MNLPTRIDNPGEREASIASVYGEALYEELKNHEDFYFFSPDETTSNKLAQVYDASPRAWGRKIESWDKDLDEDGRVIEMLSENTLFAALAGHILSGGRGAMTSYEAFLPIVSSQIDQHLKFLKQSKEISWRKPVHAINLLSTSCWQRQDHNGYTHQNPALISSLLAKPSNLVNCFFPVDDIAAAASWEFMKDSMNVVNLTTFNKIPQPRWIDINHARFQLENGGASIFQFASDENPDVILCGIGDIPTRELMEAIKLAKQKQPELKVRYVGVAALSYAAIGTTENKLSQQTFDNYFTGDKPIIVNFHGYPETIRSIFSHYADARRVSIHGYQDEGSTTSPLDELSRNYCSRYELAADILNRAGYPEYIKEFQNLAIENAEYAKIYGLDK